MVNLESGRLSPGDGRAAPTAEALTLNRYPDILQAAWGLNDAEFEAVLRLPPGAMRQWRNHELCFAAGGLTRLARLFLFHEALRFHALGHPPDFPIHLRRVWKSDSVIGARSIIAALRDADDAALEQLARFLRGTC